METLAFHILVVEDDPHICDVLDYALKAEGYSVEISHRGKAVAGLLEKTPTDLVLLDVGLPDIDGFEVCRQLRTFSNVPVIFLTSRGDELDRVVGLEIGADDYMVKPFSPRELTARIRVIRRRLAPVKSARPDLASVSLAHGGLVLDRDRFRCEANGVEVGLTRQEFRLLEKLMQQPGRVFTREQLLDGAWDDGGMVTDRAIDAHIKSLRKKICSSGTQGDWIETVRGIGYRFRE